MFSTILVDFSIETSFLKAKNEDINLKTSCWTKGIVISDDSSDWNTQDGSEPDIAIDVNGTIHVVWYDDTDGVWGTDREILYVNYTDAGWSNVTCISDIYGWNDASSDDPRIAIDNNGSIHVVWRDLTDGEWGSDYEIFYVNYTATGWSNATVISDIYGWNNGSSYAPRIAIDNNGTIHVVWEDTTDGEWGNDVEIMYTKSTTTGWTNATVISDDTTGWNDGSSWEPDIAVDGNGNIHVVWHDGTNSWWGTDWDILYTNNTGAGWSNATAISDDITQWNQGSSDRASITTDINGNVHVVWRDFTDGIWGSDEEIMYSYYNGLIWSNATVISDDNTDWNTDSSINAEIESDKYGNVHVVWEDNSDGAWGTDVEIMYAKRTSTSWSKARVISDDSSGWNNAESGMPSLSTDKNGKMHIVWEDHTDGVWGTNREIMYCMSIPSKGGPNIGLLLFQTLNAKESNLFAIIIFLGLIGLVIAIGLYGYYKSTK